MGRFLTLLAFLFMTASCLADGCVIRATAVPVEVRIPDQRALIQFTNGVERLVIETRFTGAGTNFAWVIPLPSPPAIEEASTGLFPTLQCIFQPRVRHEIPPYFRLFLGILAGGYLLRFVRPGSPITYLDVLACLGLGLMICGINSFGFLVFLFLLYAVGGVRVRGESWLHVLSFFFVMLFFGAILFGALSPALSLAGGRTYPTPAVSILDRKMVGVFETTTISSRDPWRSKPG